MPWKSEEPRDQVSHLTLTDRALAPLKRPQLLHPGALNCGRTGQPWVKTTRIEVGSSHPSEFLLSAMADIKRHPAASQVARSWFISATNAAESIR